MNPLLYVIVMALPIWVRSSAPKVFVDTDPVQLIDSLKSGFHIILRPEFVNHYIPPGRSSTVFVSVVPLNNKLPSRRIMHYREDIQEIQSEMLVDGLSAKTW